MSRFANLEFGDEVKPSPRPGLEAGATEASCLSEAQRAFETGRFRAALRAYARTLEFNPHQPLAWAGQVRMLIELGEYGEARAWADQALDRIPDDPLLLAAKGVALARDEDTKAALLFSDAAVTQDAQAPYVWLARGDVLLARREERAAYCFEKTLSLVGRSWFWPWCASRIHQVYGQYARALKWAQEALEFDAAQAVVWLQLARCQRASGLAAPARRSLARATELDPACPDYEDPLARPRRVGLVRRTLGFWRAWFGQ